MLIVVKKACFPKLDLKGCDDEMEYEGQRHVVLIATRRDQEKDKSWRYFCLSR